MKAFIYSRVKFEKVDLSPSRISLFERESTYFFQFVYLTRCWIVILSLFALASMSLTPHKFFSSLNGIIFLFLEMI